VRVDGHATNEVARGRIAGRAAVWAGGAHEISAAVLAALGGAGSLAAPGGRTEPQNTRNTRSRRNRDLWLVFFPRIPSIPRFYCAVLQELGRVGGPAARPRSGGRNGLCAY
jgi:hypothetical protein